MGGTLLIDPNSDELSEAADSNPDPEAVSEGTLTLGYLPTQEQVAALSEEGPVSPETLTEDLATLIEVAKAVLPSVQQCLIESVKANLDAQKE